MSRAIVIDPIWIPELERKMRLEVVPSRRAKLQALWMVARGSASRVEIAACTGLSVSALRLLVSRFVAEGFMCLNDARVSNARPSRVPKLELPWLEVKSAKAAQLFLLENHGVKVSVSTARRWLIRLARDIV
jgi:hypothetical protein